jgi:NADPH:quinone reductase-like Zn-dependent oxidoreductase
MMNAAIRTSTGIKFTEGSVPIPKTKAGQVLLRVKAAAINPVDYKLPKFLVGECSERGGGDPHERHSRQLPPILPPLLALLLSLHQSKNFSRTAPNIK